MQIARLAAEGLSALEIRDRLCVSVNTVKTHLEHIYSKLGVHSRIALARALRDPEENHPNR
jgi:LuxR family maltose regulon positive regulatory protein